MGRAAYGLIQSNCHMTSAVQEGISVYLVVLRIHACVLRWYSQPPWQKGRKEIEKE